jgi:hypothetical protein
MPVINLDQPTARSHYSVVYTRATWGGAWVRKNDIVATDVAWATSPDVGQARLRMRYGYREDQQKTIAPIDDPTGLYVKIEDVQSGADFDTVVRTWYGIIRSDTLQTSGMVSKNGTLIESGIQWFACVGLEDLLYRHQVIDSIFVAGDQNTQYTAERGITFNYKEKPNRTSSTNPVPVFEGDTTKSALFWSSRDIVNYLLYYQTPKKADGTTPIVFKISGADLAKIPAKDRPEITTHGVPTADLLNQVINRFRLMTWFPEYDATNNQVWIRIRRTNPSPIVLSQSGETLQANTNKMNVNTYGDPAVKVTINEKSFQQVDQVIYQSARRRHCFNIADADSTVAGQWETTQKTTFDEGASNAVDYPASEEKRERARRDRKARDVDTLRDVYARFGFPDNWDQRAGDGIGGSKNPIATQPVVGPFGGQQYYIYPPELELSPRLPLLDNKDYHGASLSNYGVTVGKPPFEEKKPFIFTPMPDDATKYVDISRMNSDGDIELPNVEKEQRWSGRVSIDRSGRSIRCDVDGAEQYVIAKDVYPGFSHDEYTPAVSYADFVFVVAVYDDRRCEGRYPPDSQLSTTADAITRQVVYLGDKYRQDDLLPDSNIMVDGETRTLQSSVGGVINDDSPKLVDLARIAFEWYALPRRSITVESVNDDENIALGVFVENWQVDALGNTTRPVNSIITRITRHYTIGESQEPPMSMMTFTTAFEQFDPLKL